MSATGSIRKQPQLLFLDSVFHFPASAINLVIEHLPVILKVGHDIARICSFVGVLGLGDHPAFAIPGARLVFKFTKEPLLFPAGLEPLKRLCLQWSRENVEPLVLCKSDYISHSMALAPTQRFPAAKPAVGPEKDLYRRPSFTHPLDQQGEHRPGVLGRV